MHVEVPRPLNWQKDRSPLSTAEMRSEVAKAEVIQLARYQGTGIARNSELSGSALRRFAHLHPEAGRLLKASFDSLGLSMRAYDRIIKLARTIADLEGAPQIMAAHVAEAIQYRCLDQRNQDFVS